VNRLSCGHKYPGFPEITLRKRLKTLILLNGFFSLSQSSAEAAESGGNRSRPRQIFTEKWRKLQR
jgi:hypothetical protein